MKLLRGVAWSAVRGWGSRFINLAVFFVSARYLTPSDLGVFSLVAAYLLVMQVLGEGGLADYIVQRSGHDQKQDSAIFYSQLASSSALAALIVGLSPWLAPLLIKHPDAIPIFIFSAITIPLTAIIRVPEALMRKALRFKALAYRGLITSAVAGVVAMVMAYQGFGVWALVVKQIVEAIIDALLIFIASRWGPGLPKIDTAILRAPYAYGSHLIGARLLDTLYSRMDVFLIGHFIGNASLGYYSVGQKIYQALFELLSKVFSNVAIPYMAREKSDMAAVKRIYLQFLQLVSMFALPSFVYVFIFSHELIIAVFGEKWIEAAWILRAFCVLGTVNCIAFFSGHVLMAMGDSKGYFAILALKSALLVGLGLIGVRFGVEGVVVAVLSAGILVVPYAHHKTRKWIGVSIADIGRALRNGVVAAVVAGLIVVVAKHWLTASSNIESAVIGLLVFGLITAGMHLGLSHRRVSEWRTRNNPTLSTR